MITSVAPPALKTVIGIWRACFASGKNFRTILPFIVFVKMIVGFTNPQSCNHVRELLAVFFVIHRQHFWGLLKQVSACSFTLAIPSNAPSICLFIPSARCFLASLQFCIFLKPWLYFSKCNCALLLFSNGDCKHGKLFACWRDGLDRYKGHTVIFTQNIFFFTQNMNARCEFLLSPDANFLIELNRSPLV